MTDVLKLNLKNCYGIRLFEASLKFLQNKPIAIYAPNGVMKSSLAHTFSDLVAGKESTDRVHPERDTIREITYNGSEPAKEAVVVIEPFSETYRSDKVSTLLVNAKLRKEFEELHSSLADNTASLLNNVSSKFGKKVDARTTILAAIKTTQNTIYGSLARIEREVEDNSDLSLVKYNFDQLFSDRVEKFFKSPSVQNDVLEYINRYDELLAASKYFKGGVFNHYNADTISKALVSNGWFQGGHSITLKSASSNQEVGDEAELRDIIQMELDTILTDKDLSTKFSKIDKPLNANKEMQDFRNFLWENQTLIPLYSDIGAFKEKVIISYLSEHKTEFRSVIDEYDLVRKKEVPIIAAAGSELNQWVEVVRIFNDRFSVPFEVEVPNQTEVVLKGEKPRLSFNFKDDENPKRLEDESLFEILSNGECRALYLLNVIFEIEARKKDKIETMFIIDDIADSFDYKNKYAIIEYLYDLSKVEHFKQIILTHNFDFYRTVCGRVGIPRENRMHAIKTSEKVIISQEKYQKNPFDHWLKNLNQPRNLLATIPFVRNIAEYCSLKEPFDKLTSTLHVKADSEKITVGDVLSIFSDVAHAKIDNNQINPNTPILELLITTCEELANETDEELDLEKKIVLAIGIRILSERYMISRTQNVEVFESNQTRELLLKLENLDDLEKSELELMQSVNILTPENIHLNSFMYEPILDMSNEHLRNTFKKVQDLKAA